MSENRWRRWLVMSAAVTLIVQCAFVAPPRSAAASPTESPSPLPSSHTGGAHPLLTGQNIVLPRDGALQATFLSADASASSDFGIDQPFHQTLIQNATFQGVGTTVSVGNFTAGSSLVFFISTPSFGTTWLSTSDHAQVVETGPGVWEIDWEDDGDFDYNDLVVEVEYDLGTEPDDPNTSANENGGTGGDPVQTFAGSLRYQHTDVAIAGRGPAVTFTRSYNSLDARSGRLGPGWTDSYNTHLAYAAGSGDILYVAADGNTDRYTANQDGTFSPPPATYRSLVRNVDRTYTVTDKVLTAETFSPDGLLTTITDRYGETATLTYDADEQLSAVSDPAGRGSLAFGYTDGLLTSVTDWASPARTVAYQYDASGRLWKVTDREGQTTTFTYDGASARIATITDARGHTALTLTYDTQGRIATQTDAQGLTTGTATTFGYVVNGDGTRVTTVTYPTTSFEPSFHPTVVDSYDAHGWLTSRVNHPSSTETLTESYDYDATGDRTSVTDCVCVRCGR